MGIIKFKHQMETEKELSEILGMSVDEFLGILDNIDSTVKKEMDILGSFDDIDAQIENGKETMPW